ncbi:DUF6492 family protein [Teredinibacter sp. KSP-S5-2]|uniref:DUF6492 family protein n=1 Tax=Teredinibacter sp. KSP-S5-2 TaxID=3034506 RepID=UPI002934A48D|nr:DUF6492 family protein [Teredinibacter sp. KSP-S5-2]WNO11320.1 DUF6492 family protein [Teredinibacter sp. KSP-S5-2]
MISAVIPVKLRHCEKKEGIKQCELLFRSLSKFCQEGTFKKIFVICPSIDLLELNVLSERWPELSIEVVDENVLIGHLRMKGFVDGWVLQQIIKLKAHELVETDFYLTFDGDCLCIRNMGYEDLVNDNKALIQLEDKKIHSQWWKGAAEVLDYPLDFNKIGMSVTPAILSRDVVKGLINELSLKYASWESKLLSYCIKFVNGQPRGWLPHQIWSEYTLYFLYLEKHGLLWDYHFTFGGEYWEETLISKKCCWVIDEYDQLEPEILFNGEGRGFFSVIQSNMNVPVAEIEALLSPYI